MDGSNLDGEVGSGGLSPEEAFSILGNGTRIGILRAIWEAPDDRVPFTELRRQLGVDDSGKFNYHVGRLADHFIRQTDGGYELRYAGEQVVRAVLAGTFIEDPSLDPTVIDSQCPYCGSQVEMRYREERITVRCTRCPGAVGDGSEFPPGTFMSYAFPPAGFENRALEEVLEAAHTLYDAKITPMMEGVCPECGGRTAVSIDVCEDHDADGVCDRCGSRHRIWSEYACEHCRYTRRCMVWFRVLTHPAVVAFYYEHTDLDETVPFAKFTWRNAQYVMDITEEVVSEDPLRIRVTIPVADATLHVTVNGDLEIVAIE